MKKIISSIFLLLLIPACSPYRSKSKYKEVPIMDIHSTKMEIFIPDVNSDEASIQYTSSISEFKPAIL